MSLLLAASACSDDVVQVDNSTKEAITLVAGTSMVGGTDTRAITVDPGVSGRGTMPQGTRLCMVMKSEQAVAPNGTSYAATRATVGAADAQKVSAVSFAEAGCTRYWDDCYARDAQLSVYAACAPGATADIKIGNVTTYPYTSTPTTGAWSTTAIPLTIADWTVSTTQTTSTLKSEDLCYSNNIADNTSAGKGDGRLMFRTATRKFDTGNLCFYHALSKLTFEIVMGEGFSASEFLFANGTNLKLTNFFTKNTVFDLVTGEFTGTYSTTAITALAPRATATTGSAYTLDALVMPTTDMSATTAGDIEFTIANNNYKLTRKDLLDHIEAADKTNHMIDGTKLKPGVHYIFTLRIGKTKVDDITANIVDWETVTATEMNPSNAKTVLTLEDRTGNATDADIYRKAETSSTITGDITAEDGKGYVWQTGYGDANAFTGTPRALATPWYWPDNKTFYHFRAIAPVGRTKQTADGKDYVTLAHGESYTDVCWGAPFKDIAASAKIAYNTTNGFDATAAHQIHPAIGATESTIKLLLFHMMSNVTFNVYTTEASSEDHVELGDGTAANHTTLKLEQIYTAGRAYMGNGLSEATGTRSDFTFTAQPAPNAEKKVVWENYGAIPQSLDGVILVITTPDNNEYKVTMKDVVATSAITNNNVQYPAYTANKISQWYPGVKYTYNFKLTKQGVIDLTATIVDWEDVASNEQGVVIQ